MDFLSDLDGGMWVVFMASMLFLLWAMTVGTDEND